MDPQGVRFILTCKEDRKSNNQVEGSFDHFRPEHFDRFIEAQNGYQGFAYLGFQVGQGDLDQIAAQYRAKHPKLLVHEGILEYPEQGFRIFEVFAYYQGKKLSSKADQGTVIRF